MKMLLLCTALTFVAVVGYKLLVTLHGQHGLLATSIGESPEPERVLMIAGAVTAVVAYASSCLATIGTGVCELTEPESWMVALAGGSNLTYLIGKSIRLNRGE